MDVSQLTKSKTVIRSLPVKLTDPELITSARRLADLTQSIATQIEGEKSRKAEAKGHQSRLETERTAVSQMVASGRRHDDVACTLYLDYTTKIAQLIRDDTGDVIETRRMTDGELQPELPIAPDDAPDAGMSKGPTLPDAADEGGEVDGDPKALSDEALAELDAALKSASERGELL